MSPWWTELTGTYIGAFGGAGLGTLGGIYGAVAGTLAQRGRARRVVLGVHVAILATGLVALAAGIVAVSMGQPYHVFYPLLLIGVVISAVMGSLWPAMRRRYMDAERRHLEAEEIRRTAC